MNYQSWLTEWLEIYLKPTVKVRTYDKYLIMVQKHIAPSLGTVELENLTADVLQRYIVNLSKVRSTSYVNSVITVIQSSLKMAVAMGVTSTQHADKVIRPKIQERKTECFTVAEQRKIERAAFKSKDKKMFGVVLCLYTGIRLGELLSMKWSDIDFTKGLLTINHSCHYGKTEEGDYIRITDTPKTHTSQRVIPLPKQLLPYLREMKRTSKCEYVINKHGKPVETRTYQYRFAFFLKNLKIPPRNFHSLRHTFATRALECGMDVKTLSEILGHKNPTITLNRYAHSLIEYKQGMMNKLGKRLNSDVTF